jgi:hypothetical protein
MLTRMNLILSTSSLRWKTQGDDSMSSHCSILSRTGASRKAGAVHSSHPTHSVRSGSVWARSGGAVRSARGKPFPVFGLLAPNRPLRRTENPRVDGSIPSLATISNSMNCNGFRASPADYPWPDGTDPRTIGKWVGLAGAVHPTGRRAGQRSAGCRLRETRSQQAGARVGVIK